MRLLDHAQRLLHLLPPVRTIMDDNVRLQRQLVELAAELATVRAAGGIAEWAAAELPKLRERIKGLEEDTAVLNDALLRAEREHGESREDAHRVRGEAQALSLRLEAAGRGLHLYRLLREVTGRSGQWFLLCPGSRQMLQRLGSRLGVKARRLIGRGPPGPRRRRRPRCRRAYRGRRRRAPR